MAGRAKQEVDIRDLSRRIEYWRRTRQKLHPMPAELWDAAVVAAREHGPCQTARWLGINYHSLRSRCEAPGPDGAREPTMSFVELKPPAVVPEHESTVEVSDAAGHKVTVRLPPAARIDDIAKLARELWRCSR